MTNSIGAQAGREELLDQYLLFYSGTWAAGSRQVCKEAQVMDQARQVLTQTYADHRFTLLPFYPSVMEMTSSRGALALRQMIRAAELLEACCVNLWLFPWKKEFKALKKFTASFVYHIQPALPNQTMQNILRQIGYRSETDSEFMLADDVDPNAAKQMGFELFLARLECEHLLEATNCKSDAECLGIVQERAASRNGDVAEEEPPVSGRHAAGGVLEEDGHLQDDLPPSPEPSPEQSPIQSLKPEVLDVNGLPKNAGRTEVRRRLGFISEDKSIMEMQESYPDLAFRQKPIFPNAGKKRHRGKELPTNELSSDMSGPQSIALHADAKPHGKLQIPECTAEEKQLVPQRAGAVRDKSASKAAKKEDEGLTELAEKFDRMEIKELEPKQPLKFPVEETTRPQTSQTQTTKNEPIMCSPSPESVCNITDCGSCSVSARLQPNDAITEPPQSFYIPNCLNCSSAPAPPVEHDENS